MRAALGFVSLVMVFMLMAWSPGSAATTDAQARANCAKLADKNGVSPTTRQRFIDSCVTKMMANQKK